MTHYDPFSINYRALGRMVHAKREKEGLSLRELAKITNVSASTICRVERGLSIEAGHFFSLLEYLGVEVRSFVPVELL